MNIYNILLADDSENDNILTKEGFENCGTKHILHFVTDGQMVLNYLNGVDKYANRAAYPLPHIVILDINMPKLSGLETLKALKADEKFSCIPVIMLSSSNNDGDIMNSYKHGASGYITKPIDFMEICEILKIFSNYWTKVMSIPKAS